MSNSEKVFGTKIGNDILYIISLMVKRLSIKVEKR